MSNLREQILARIAKGANELGYRPPTLTDFIYATRALFHDLQIELSAMLSAGIIDTQTGDSGLTYIIRKTSESAPSPHAPVKLLHIDRPGLAFFPSKNPTAQPLWHEPRSPGEKETLRACTIPRRESKSEINARAKAERAEKRAEKVKAAVVKKSLPPPDRTSYENRALVTKHLTHPMSAAQFAELAGMKENRGRSILYGMAERNFIQKDVHRLPKMYFFERPANAKLAEFRAIAQQFKARKDIDIAAICAEYKGGAKMKEIARNWKCSESTICLILDEQGVQKRVRGQLLKGVPRAESRKLVAENLALKALIAKLQFIQRRCSETMGLYIPDPQHTDKNEVDDAI